MKLLWSCLTGLCISAAYASPRFAVYFMLGAAVFISMFHLEQN